MPGPSKTGILLVTFGSTMTEARQVYDLIETEVRERYPGHPLVWGFTAGYVRKKLAAQGIELLAPSEAINHLLGQSADAIAVQPFYISPGGEFETLKRDLSLSPVPLHIGRPLLGRDEDIDDAVDVLAAQVRDGVPNVLACHGSNATVRFNDAHQELGRRLGARFSNVCTASLEGQPGDAVLEIVRDLVDGHLPVHFIPVLLADGRHVQEDIMGNGPDSWRNRVRARECTCAPPLGLQPGMRALFYNHLAQAIAEVEGKR